MVGAFCVRRLASLAIAGLFLFPVVSSAQPYQSPTNPDSYYVSSWQRLRDLSLQLESAALRARSEAKIDSRHHGSGELAEKIDDFAKDAHRFRLLMTERNVPASKINDEIRKLVDDGRNVQKESAKADRHNPRTDADWNAVVGLLDQVNHEYMAANGLVPPVGTTGQYSTYPGERHYRSWADDRRTIIGDLDRRADDAARLSESANLEITPEIERLRTQVRTFQQNADELSASDTQAHIARMLADARAAQSDLAGSNAPAQLRDDINAMVGTLVQMREMTSGAAGTSGFGPPPGVASDRYATMTPTDLERELDSRTARFADLAADLDSDDISGDLAHFQDQLRDFDSRSERLSREDRREALDSLLEQAQKTQRDLARRHVSSDLTNEWNRVVTLLVRMRDGS